MNTIPVLIIKNVEKLIQQIIPSISDIIQKTGIKTTLPPEFPSCLPQDEVQNILNIRNNLVNKLNSTAKIIESLSKITDTLTPILNTTKTSLNITKTAVNTTKIAIAFSAALISHDITLNGFKWIIAFLFKSLTTSRSKFKTI